MIVETRIKLIAILVVVVFIALAFAVEASGQSCIPPISQGSVNAPGNCHQLTIRFLNQQSSFLIDHYETRWTVDGVRHTLPGSALSDTRNDLPGGASSQLEITQFNKNGATCSMVTTTSPAPHAAPCGSSAGSGISIVSSANFRQGVSRKTLVSAFPDPGQTFTDRSEHAATIPLPTTLAGVSVEANGQLCGIVDATPGQLNILLPANLPEGPLEVPIVVNSTRGTVTRFSGRAQVNPQSVGIFTRNATGQGVAAFVWLVVSINGQQRYFAPGALPVIAGSDAVFLLLFGTGINTNSGELRLTNGRTFATVYLGDTVFPGLNQLTFRIPNADIWSGQIGGFVRVFVPAGSYDGNGFELIR